MLTLKRIEWTRELRNNNTVRCVAHSYLILAGGKKELRVKRSIGATGKNKV